LQLAITLFVLLSFLISLFFLKETLPKEKRSPFRMGKIGRDFKRAFMCIPFWQTTSIVSLLFAGYIMFLSGAAVLFVVELGVSKEALPFYQAANLGAWLLASLTCTRAMARWGNDKLKRIGTLLILIGGILMVASAFIDPMNPYLPTIGMLVYSFGSNWVQGLYFPEGMETLPDIKGVTASLLTSARLLISAAVVGIASQLYDGSIYPLVGVIAGIIALTLPLIAMYERQRPKREYSESTTISMQAH
jgi:MFS transporter, DHA1 family, multidrug resistance protein